MQSPPTNPTPTAPPSDRDSASSAGRGPANLLACFYAVMATIALYGQSDGLMTWLDVPRGLALLAAAAVELLAAALFAFADWRAIHHSVLYVGASLAGYAVWVLHAGARRRDALRTAGKLPAPAPVYGLWRWATQPWLTARARALAGADPTLGLYGSIQAASQDRAAQRRHKAITVAVRRQLSKNLDPVSAELAMISYDLDRLARDLAAQVDHPTLAALLAADLDPNRLHPVTAGTHPNTTGARARRRRHTTADDWPVDLMRRIPVNQDAYHTWRDLWTQLRAGADPAELAAAHGVSDRQLQFIRAAGTRGLLDSPTPPAHRLAALVADNGQPSTAATERVRGH